MTASSTPPLHVLRGILRTLKKSSFDTAALASSLSSQTPKGSSIDSNALTLRQHVLSQYRASMSLSPEKARGIRGIAYDYWMLQSDLVERARLHELDMGAEEKLSPKELSQRAAARAGLQLPKLDNNI